MKKLALIFSGAALAYGFASTAAAQNLAIACAKPGDERKIEVFAPGEIGENCDVRYTRSGAVTTPYHADNSPPSYCMDGARSLATNLESAGFACAEVGVVVAAAPPPAEPEAETLAPESLAVAAPPPARLAPPPAAPEPELEPETETETVTAALEQVDSPDAEKPAVEQREAAILETEMNRILAEPAFEPAGPQPSAVKGPAQLTAGLASAPATRPAPTPIGKLVGAAPEPALAPTAASAVSAPEQTVTPPTPAASRTTAPRKPEDIVKATLQAQAAAWNEGDLDAFMATYWKSDELKFISDGAVSKGWSATMKHYRDVYVDENGLGRLALEKLDVEMVTDDVAVVTGRFNLARNTGASTGSFSLVMRRMGGVWRIVHDHSNTDAPE